MQVKQNNWRKIDHVPMLDLKTQYKSIKHEIDKAILRVVESQMFILGPEVSSLEKEFAEYCGCRFAVGVSSGTDAIMVSLMALGITAGDEVITTPFTFFATVASIIRLGATPVFADIEPTSYNIDPNLVRNAISSKTKTIIPVHMFGQCADMEPILEMSRQHNIPIVDDAAQAIGAQYKGNRIGNIGTLGCFSFFPSKNLGAFGDAGMITTNDEILADRLRIIRHQGTQPKYHHKILGGNFRLDALQAAILRVKLKYLPTWTEERGNRAAYYTKRIYELGLAPEKVVPPQVIFDSHIFNYYVIKAQNRDSLKKFLADHNVASEIYYPVPMHLQESINSGQYKPGDFPICEKACKDVLALPIYPELTEEQQEYVVQMICQYYGVA